MNILVVCRRGNVRSVCLANTLTIEHGHTTLARGATYCENMFEKKDVEWADKIIIFEDWMMHLFDRCLGKVIYIGNMPDTYFDPEHPRLKEYCLNVLPYLKRYDERI